MRLVSGLGGTEWAGGHGVGLRSCLPSLDASVTCFWGLPPGGRAYLGVRGIARIHCKLQVTRGTRTSPAGAPAHAELVLDAWKLLGVQVGPCLWPEAAQKFMWGVAHIRGTPYWACARLAPGELILGCVIGAVLTGYGVLEVYASFACAGPAGSPAVR